MVATARKPVPTFQPTDAAFDAGPPSMPARRRFHPCAGHRARGAQRRPAAALSCGRGLVIPYEDGRLVGVITDGDLRRNIERGLDHEARDFMTSNPKTIAPDSLVDEL